MPQWFYDRPAEPNFKQIVDKSLDLFAVFTGVPLAFFVKDFLFENTKPGFAALSLTSRVFVAAAVIALLLRFIVGSAAHLNSRYKPQKPAAGGAKVAELPSLRWLFCDIVFLVLFGTLAVYIVYAGNLHDLMVRAFGFIAAGLAWGVLAVFFRKKDRPIARPWMAINTGQLAITAVLIWGPWRFLQPDSAKTAILAGVYVFCLFLDFTVVARPPRQQVAAAWSKEANAYKETGDVWGVRIPYPSPEVLADMGWAVFDKANMLVRFEAYVIRQLVNADQSVDLNMRFHDRSNPPRDPNETITVRFIHPQP